MYLNDIYYCSELSRIVSSDLNINNELENTPIPFSKLLFSFNMPIYDFYTDGIKSFEYYLFINDNYNQRLYIIFKSKSNITNSQSKVLKRRNTDWIFIQNNKTINIKINNIAKSIFDITSNKLYQNITNYNVVVLSGHGYAGLIAQMFALHLSKHRQDLRIKLYTMGIPKNVCNNIKELYKNLSIHHVNIINKYDMITELNFYKDKCDYLDKKCNLYLGSYNVSRNKPILTKIRFFIELIKKKYYKNNYIPSNHNLDDYIEQIQYYKNSLQIYT